MKIRNLQHEQSLILTKQEKESTLLQILWLNNIKHNSVLCSGVGKCGKCKIRYISPAPPPTKDEELLLTQEEIDTNIRLSCKHNAKNDSDNEICIELLSFYFNEKPKNIDNTNQDKKYSLAIDFGTTSMEYAFIHNTVTLEQNSVLNPMQGIGSEVMERILFALSINNPKILQERVWIFMEDIIYKHGYSPKNIEQISFSANTAMTYLAFGIEANSLGYAPYSLSFNGGKNIELQDFTNLPPVYIPPLLAPFVGGDISAGLYALEKTNAISYPYMFIDMGTNAEFALVLSKDTALIASVPLGPSLEGIGLSFGTIASANSIIDFNLSPKGLEYLFLDNSNKVDSNEVDGICGVAYLHLLSILKNVGLLLEDGQFNKNLQILTPLAKKIAHFSQINGIDILQLAFNFYLSTSDIESILKVKSAFISAFDMLLEEAGIALQSLDKVYLAGTFGKYINGEALTNLGFLPKTTLHKIQQVGNTSLEGAKLLINPQAQNNISTMFKNYRHIELADKAEFQNFYIDNFNFKTR